MDKLGIDWRILIAQTISFSIVFFVLWKFAYGPIFAMLEARTQKIAEASPTPRKSRPNSRARKPSARRFWPTRATQANKLIEEARAAAARVQEAGNAKSHRRRGADHRQSPRSRRRRITRRC